MEMPEFPWRCPKCHSDDVHYVDTWYHGGAWITWECRRGVIRHRFVSLHD